MNDIQYPNDYLYFGDLVEFGQQFNPTLLEGKKVLFTFGDSWTNNRYVKSATAHWCYLLKEKLGYDYVVNVSNEYDSNYQIFDTVNRVLSNPDYPMEKKPYLDDLKEYKVVIEWSTPMRDSTSVAMMYSPFNMATIPDESSDTPNTKLWMEYVSNWFRTEVYSYDTQKRMLFLQEFFKHNNIDWYAFMGFTPLVEKEFEGTPYDLREWIDENRFMYLNGFPNNMQDYLITTMDESFNDELGITEMQYPSKREKYFLNDDELFTGDGHPYKKGLEIMSEQVYKKIV